jgi:ABC-type multidrug transport system permease subunit
MLNKVLKLIKNNIILITRSKSSATIILLGPLLVLFLVAIVFNSQGFYSVKVSYAQNVDTDITKEIIKSINNKNFEMEKTDYASNCIDSVKQGISNLCIVFEGDFEIKEEMDNKIEVYADYSQLNLAWIVIETISNEVEQTSTNISKNMVEILLEKIDVTKKEIQNNQKILKEINDINLKLEEENVLKIENEIEKIDIKFNAKEIEIENITQTTKINQNKIKVLLENTRVFYSDMKKKVKRLILNETEKEEVLFDINRSETKFLLLKNQTIRQEKDIGEITEIIKQDLERLEQKLSKSNLNVVQIKNETLKIRKNLEEIEGLVSEMDERMEEMKANLNSLTLRDSNKIAMPITTNLNPIVQEKTHINYMFPGVIVLLIMFISLFFASSLMIMEKNSKAYMRNLLTPVHDIVFIISNYITSLIIVLFQVTMIFGILKAFDLISFSGNFFLLMLIVIIASTLFVLIGMCIGYIFSTPQGAIISSFSVSGVFLLLSGLMIPIEAIPSKMVRLIEFNPFMITLDAIRKIMFYSFEFANISTNVVYLGIMIIPVFLITIFLHDKFYRENLIFKRKKK